MDASIRRFQVPLDAGRVLDVLVAGPENGTPFVFHHGTPASRIDFKPFIDAAVARGSRYISYSRPGYGDSTRQQGRTVADCSIDTANLLDRLGADRFYTVGWSGGGPHALACAALLPKRVIAAATIAGVAPWGAAGLDWLGGMGKENIEEFHAALAGPEQLQAFLEVAASVFAKVTPDQIVSAFGDLVDDVDRGALTGEFAEFLARGGREGLRNGFWGWHDDDIAFTRPWGFDLARVTVPVTVWQGGKDRMVPFAHGRWLAGHISGARAELLREEGHLSLAVEAFWKIMDGLMSSRKL